MPVRANTIVTKRTNARSVPAAINAKQRSVGEVAVSMIPTSLKQNVSRKSAENARAAKTVSRFGVSKENAFTAVRLHTQSALGCQSVRTARKTRTASRSGARAKSA